MSERVTAILATDGRHVLVGRYSQPSEAELAQARDAIAAQGLRAWLVHLHGDRWAKRGPGPQIEMIRALHDDLTTDDWATACAAFRVAHKARQAAL